MDLSLATFEELIEELQQRTTNCLFVCTQEGKLKNTASNRFWFKASASELLGLAEYAKQQARECYKEYVQ